MRRPRRLEVGRIGRAHGLRGEVVVTPVSNVAERFAPGSTLVGRRTRAYVIASSRPNQHRFVVRFEGVDDRDGAEALRGKIVEAEPLAERARGRAVGARADRLRGARPRRRRARHGRRGRGESRARPARARRRRARPDGLRRVVASPAWSSSTCPTACSTSDRDRRAHRRLHDLPRVPRRAAAACRCSGARATRACSTCACTTRVRSRPTGTAASTTSRSAAARGW